MQNLSGDPSADDPPTGVDLGADLDDVSRCPCGFRCESCGVEPKAGDLLTYAVHAAVGTLCLTLCDSCATSSVDPPISVGTAARLVAQHREHVTGSSS